MNILFIDNPENLYLVCSYTHGKQQMPSADWFLGVFASPQSACCKIVLPGSLLARTYE
jgi:hypothetical protein